MAKQKRKPTPVRRRRPAKRMTALQMRLLCNGLNADAYVIFWFDPVDKWIIHGDGTFGHKDRQGDALRCWIEDIVRGTELHACTSEEGDGEALEFYVESEREDFIELGGVYAIEIIDKGTAPPKKVELTSINESMTFDGGDQTVSVGCRQMSWRDGIKAFKALGEWLGYEITD